MTRASLAEPNLGIGMAIDPERLASVLARVDVSRQALVAGEMLGVAVNRASPELLDATLRLLRLLDRPEDIPAMAPLVEEEILYRLLTGSCGPRLLHIARSDTPSNRRGEGHAAGCAGTSPSRSASRIWRAWRA